MIVLDTNVLSEIFKAHPDHVVMGWFSAQRQNELYVTSVTQAEMLFGLAILPKGQRRDSLEQAVRDVFAEDFAGRILPFDSEAAVAFASIASRLRRLGRPISQLDAQAAAIAHAHEASLATRNVTDFQNCGLSIVNPWQIQS